MWISISLYFSLNFHHGWIADWGITYHKNIKLFLKYLLSLLHFGDTVLAVKVKCSLFKRFDCFLSSAVQSQELPVWFCAARCHCPLAGTMRDLFLLLSPSGNANGLGSCGTAETLKFGVAALARAIRGIILCAGPAGSAVGGKLNPGNSGSPLSVDSQHCLLQGIGKTFYKLPAVPCHSGVGGSSPFVPAGSAGPAGSCSPAGAAALRHWGGHGLAQWPSQRDWTLPQSPHNRCTSPFLSLSLPQKRQLISVCHLEWLFCWWCVPRGSVKGCVHCGGRLAE